MTGIVKWFDKIKGFGFIKPESLPNDVFVYYADIVNNAPKGLEAGQKVNFEVTKSERGLKAINVLILK